MTTRIFTCNGTVYNIIKEEYYSSGNIKSRAEFTENKADWLYTAWNEDGKINCKNIYKNGTLVITQK